MKGDMIGNIIPPPYTEILLGVFLKRRDYALQPGSKICFKQPERFAIVDELAPVRFLSREEFESLKNHNPWLIEMRAGDIRYLTEPPMRS